MTESKGVVVKISSLWHCESKKSIGGEYFRGKMGDCYILLFHNPSNHPKSPEFDLCVVNKKSSRRPKSDKVESPPDVEEIPSESPEPENNEWEEGIEEAYPDEGEVEDEDQDVPF